MELNILSIEIVYSEYTKINCYNFDTFLISMLETAQHSSKLQIRHFFYRLHRHLHIQSPPSGQFAPTPIRRRSPTPDRRRSVTPERRQPRQSLCFAPSRFADLPTHFFWILTANSNQGALNIFIAHFCVKSTPSMILPLPHSQTSPAP